MCQPIRDTFIILICEFLLIIQCDGQDIFINQEMVNRGYAVEDGSFPPQPSKPEPNTSDDQGISERSVYRTR